MRFQPKIMKLFHIMCRAYLHICATINFAPMLLFSLCYEMRIGEQPSGNLAADLANPDKDSSVTDYCNEG
jgi:hypothetical protein